MVITFAARSSKVQTPVAVSLHRACILSPCLSEPSLDTLPFSLQSKPFVSLFHYLIWITVYSALRSKIGHWYQDLPMLQLSPDQQANLPQPYTTAPEQSAAFVRRKACNFGGCASLNILFVHRIQGVMTVFVMQICKCQSEPVKVYLLVR